MDTEVVVMVQYRLEFQDADGQVKRFVTILKDPRKRLMTLRVKPRQYRDVIFPTYESALEAGAAFLTAKQADIIQFPDHTLHPQEVTT